MRRCRARVTRRCWAPSWRLRSSRRRSVSAASTMRARESLVSSSWARSSARSRSLSSARPAALETASSRAGSSLSAASWTSAATFSPRRSRIVTARAAVGTTSTCFPSTSTYSWDARHPVAELERGVSQGTGERVSKLSWLRVIAQLDDELADPDPRKARLEQTEEIGDRHGGEGQPLGRLEARRDARRTRGRRSAWPRAARS